MLTVIHQMLVKYLNETCDILLATEFWSNRQMRSYTNIKSKRMLCGHRVLQR